MFSSNNPWVGRARVQGDGSGDDGALFELAVAAAFFISVVFIRSFRMHIQLGFFENRAKIRFSQGPSEGGVLSVS